MLRIQGTERSKRMAGRKPDGTVEAIPEVIFARKHLIDKKGWKEIKQFTHLFCFVSSPRIYTQEKLRKKSKGWCHALRNESRLPSHSPNILLPESDFLDSRIVCCNHSPKIKYDYFYFTLNASAGVEHKGLYTFFDALPILAKHQLRGKIIVYYPNSGSTRRFMVKMTRGHRQNLARYSGFLDFHWGLLSDKQMDDVMTSCRFGFFPNTVDNSPRILAECLIRNVPALVNKKIDGGWHYITPQTGSLFSMDNLQKKLEFMMGNAFSPRDYWDKNFGFIRSSAKLAQFVNGILGTDYTHIYFYDFRRYLSEL